MDPRTNPYSPGAGTPPPELAGRVNCVMRRMLTCIDLLRKTMRIGRLLTGAAVAGIVACDGDPSSAFRKASD